MKTLLATVLLLAVMRVEGQQIVLTDDNNQITVKDIFFEGPIMTAFCEDALWANLGMENIAKFNVETKELIPPGVNYTSDQKVIGCIQFEEDTFYYGGFGVDRIVDGEKVNIFSIKGWDEIVKNAIILNGELIFTGSFTTAITATEFTSLESGGAIKLNPVSGELVIFDGMQKFEVRASQISGDSLSLLCVNHSGPNKICYLHSDGTMTEMPSSQLNGFSLDEPTAMCLVGNKTFIASQYSGMDGVQIFAIEGSDPMYWVAGVGGSIITSLEYNPTTNEVYAGGDFYNPDHVINSLAKVNLATEELSFLGGASTGLPSIIYCLAFGDDGKLYLGGDFNVKSYDLLTGIVSPVSTANITVGPNPCIDVINISFPEYFQGEVSIYDLSGRIVHTEQFSGSNIQINTSNLAPGVYLLTVRSNNHILKSIKIVKG